MAKLVFEPGSPVFRSPTHSQLLQHIGSQPFLTHKAFANPMPQKTRFGRSESFSSHVNLPHLSRRACLPMTTPASVCDSLLQNALTRRTKAALTLDSPAQELATWTSGYQTCPSVSASRLPRLEKGRRVRMHGVQVCLQLESPKRPQTGRFISTAN